MSGSYFKIRDMERAVEKMERSGVCGDYELMLEIATGKRAPKPAAVRAMAREILRLQSLAVLKEGGAS